MKFQRILIGIDDSKYAEHAAEYGFELAHAFKSEVGLVHIVEPMVMSQTNDPGILGSMTASVVPEMEIYNIKSEYSENLISHTIKKFAGDLQVSHFNEFGSTAEGIIDCANQFKADLIVIGTHSRTGLDRFFMGSIAEHVIRHSSVPVLVVPMKVKED